jgi:hypothetical protein
VWAPESVTMSRSVRPIPSLNTVRRWSTPADQKNWVTRLQVQTFENVLNRPNWNLYFYIANP